MFVGYSAAMKGDADCSGAAAVFDEGRDVNCVEGGAIGEGATVGNVFLEGAFVVVGTESVNKLGDSVLVGTFPGLADGALIGVGPIPGAH